MEIEYKYLREIDRYRDEYNDLYVIFALISDSYKELGRIRCLYQTTPDNKLTLKASVLIS